MYSPADYVRAFKRNCPGVRMLKDEERELERLIAVSREEYSAFLKRPVSQEPYAENHHNG